MACKPSYNRPVKTDEKPTQSVGFFVSDWTINQLSNSIIFLSWESHFLFLINKLDYRCITKQTVW